MHRRRVPPFITLSVIIGGSFLLRISRALILSSAVALAGPIGALAQYTLVVAPGYDTPFRGGREGAVLLSDYPTLDGHASIHYEPEGRQVAYGISVGVQHSVSLLNISYAEFSYDITSVPVTVGARYYPLGGALRPFAGLDVGVSFLHFNFDNIDGHDEFSRTGFTVIPTVGFKLKVIGRLGIDATLLYHHTLFAEVVRGYDLRLEGSAFSSYSIDGGLSYTFDLE